MENLFAILLKVSLSIVVFYLVFLFFLRKETFFVMNRYYLLFALVGSFFLPFFPVHYNVVIPPENKMKTISVLGEGIQSFSGIETGSSFSLDIYTVLLVIYLTGIVLFLGRLVLQTMVIIRLVIKSDVRIVDGFRVVQNDKYGLPFSFFRLIFINPKFHKQEDLSDILNHERVHVEQNHWIDLLIIELLTVIFWFNPFIWLFERSIKQNHEYLADKGVLSRGSDLGRYQALLINQLMGMQIIGVTNNLNFALNTNRFKMMTKIQSKKIKAIRFFIAFPALFILMAAFAEPDYKLTQAESQVTVSDLFLSSKETFVVKGVVKAEDGTPLPGASVILKNTTTGTSSGENGEFSLEVPKNEIPIIVVSFVGFGSEELKIPESSSKEVSKEVSLKREQILVETKNVDKILSVPPPPPPASEDKKENVFFIVEEMPSYPGGHYALMEYYKDMKKKLSKKLFFEDKKVNGEALVGFTVNAKGKIVNIKVLEKDNDVVAKAAFVLVQNMEDWNPGKQRGKPVPVDYVIPVVFD